MLLRSIINIILDPIAIFVLKWGMMGAAVATVIGQVATTIMLVFYFFHTKSFKLKKSSFKPDFKLSFKAFSLGLSSFITQISIVLVMATMNNTLVKYGALTKYGSDIPLTVIGIVMKVFAIINSFTIGLAIGFQPIVGYNFGAKNYTRVKDCLKKLILWETIVGIVGLLIFEFQIGRAHV